MTRTSFAIQLKWIHGTHAVTMELELVLVDWFLEVITPAESTLQFVMEVFASSMTRLIERFGRRLEPEHEAIWKARVCLPCHPSLIKPEIVQVLSD